MMPTKQLQVGTGADFSPQCHQCKEGPEAHTLRPYWAPVQKGAAGLVTLMLITVLTLAGCADRPQAQHSEAHEPCVVPRGGFDCGDQAKQEDNFMRFEQQGHQLP